MTSRSKVLLFLVSLSLSGCLFGTYPSHPTVTGFRKNPEPHGKVETLRGVVTGLWKLDPKQTLERMTKYEGHLTPQEISELSQRYVVRVGFRTAPPFEVLSPIRLSKSAERVVLPIGWSHDPFNLSHAPEVVNVGDVVEIRFGSGRYYQYLVAVVRQCDAPPSDGEKKEWKLGCKTYKNFDSSDFAGESY
jgi:hypothetical protein